MFLCIDEQSPVFRRADAATRRLIEQLESQASSLVRASGPDALYDAVVNVQAWDDEVVFIGAPDGMSAAVSGWVNSGRSLERVRWSYLSSPVRDGWTAAIKSIDPPAERWMKLSRRENDAPVRLLRVDISTSEVPRIGLSAAFGGTAGLWGRLVERSGSAMDWPRIALDWASSLRDGIPVAAREISLDHVPVDPVPNFAAIYARDPFSLFPLDEQRADPNRPLTWRAANLTASQLGEFLRQRGQSSLIEETPIREATFRNPGEVSVDGWHVRTGRGAVVRVGVGPEIHLHTYGLR